MTVRRDFRALLCLSTALSIGLVFAATEIAAAASTSRDHRGADGAPSGGVTVNGKKAKVAPTPTIGGPKWKGGYDTLGADGEKGHKSGVTVRDHR